MKKLLTQEIENSKNAIKSLSETQEKCEKGITLQKIILEKFQEELRKF